MVRFKAALLSAFALAAVALVLGACGGDDDSSSDDSSQANTPSSGANADAVAKAKANVERLSKISGIDWPKPPGPFDPGEGRIAILTDGNAGQESLHNAKEVVEATKLAGWEPSPILDGEYNPNVQNQNVRTAIQQGYDAIILLALPPGTVKAGLAQAFREDILVACVMCYGFDPGPGNEDKFVEATPGGFEGEAMGNWIVADSGGKAKIMAWVDNAYPIVQNRMATMQKVFDELCPECEVEMGTNQTTDLSEPGPPFFTAALAANPKGSFQYAVGGYDPLSFQMWKTASQAGRDEIKVGGFDANPPNVAEIAKGGTPELVTVAEPYTYAAWSALDNLMRIKAGEETWDASKMPFALVNKDNVADYPKSGFFEDPEFDFRAMYEEMWGGS